MLKIFANTWGNYNVHGADNGRWITLPMSEDELDATLEEIAQQMHDNDPEWFVNDYEWEDDSPFFMKLSESEDFFTLNELCYQLDEMDSYEQNIVAALLEEGYDLEQAMESKDDCTVYNDCEGMEDVARAYAEETRLLDSIPENLRYYFDFAAFGRDMAMENTFVFMDNGDCIEIH